MNNILTNEITEDFNFRCLINKKVVDVHNCLDLIVINFGADNNECYNEADATLWVHIIKKKEYSDEWRSKFCAEILPVIKERYNEYFVSDKLPTIYRKRYEMNVYLGKNGFEIVETFS